MDSKTYFEKTKQDFNHPMRYEACRGCTLSVSVTIMVNDICF